MFCFASGQEQGKGDAGQAGIRGELKKTDVW